MNKILLSVFIVIWTVTAGMAGMLNPDSLSSSFHLSPASACVNQHVEAVYEGNAPANADYLWNFDGGIIISGSGQGPYVVKWETTGVKVVTLTVNWELQTSTSTREIHIVPLPEMFEMTGGGVYIPGGPAVSVGLSGSQLNIIYKLRKNGIYTGLQIVGTGSPMSFGSFTEPGSYSAIAKVDGADCIEEMAGNAVITLGGTPPQQHICMVTFDTLEQKNTIVWNKIEGPGLSHFNIYKETFVNGEFEKIAEVPYLDFSTYTDPNSFPLVKSDRYRISVSDSAGFESEKSPHHKTIHLNISAGIYGFNLIWNHYEGYDYVTYKIYRKLGTDPFEWLASVASNVDSYTDFYTQSGFATYYIEAVRLEPCNPSLKNSGFTSAISNYATAAPLGIGENGTGNVSIYPNPMEDRLNIERKDNQSGFVNLKIVSQLGQVLLQQVLTGTKTQVDLSGLVSGLYFVQLDGAGWHAVRKIVKR
jgi:hypothetical protein